jgi:hypothetical protein
MSLFPPAVETLPLCLQVMRYERQLRKYSQIYTVQCPQINLHGSRYHSIDRRSSFSLNDCFASLLGPQRGYMIIRLGKGSAGENEVLRKLQVHVKVNVVEMVFVPVEPVLSPLERHIWRTL